MAIGKKKSLRADKNGAALLEFTVVVAVFMIILFGVVEFALAFYQWNAAAKALQVGARLAAVSSPVWDNVHEVRGDEVAVEPGTPLSTNSGDPSAAGFGYSVTCSQPNPPSAGSCVDNDDLKDTGINNLKTDFDETALRTLVFGRSSNSCTDASGAWDESPGMCDIYPAIGVENVRITYEHSNLGYATRPGGLVPTIRLELVGMSYDFLFIDGLVSFFTGTPANSISIPGLITTLAAEDMCSRAPGVDPVWHKQGGNWVDSCT